jgi:hypothetical protein
LLFDRDELIGKGPAALALAVAGVFHAAEVAHNVYKAW